MAAETLSLEATAFQGQFDTAFTAAAGFFYPYHLTASSGDVFWCNVWPASVKSSAYARAVQQTPQLAHADVRFMLLKPGEVDPGEGARMEFEGGVLTLHAWGQVDPISGESLGACEWLAG